MMGPDSLRALPPSELSFHWPDEHHADWCQVCAHVDAWEAEREWKKGFDEGEAHGMRSNTSDSDNPYPAASHAFCGWSYGFWSSRHASMARSLQAQIKTLRGALADIAFSGDMTLVIAQAKAKRTYEALAAGEGT